MKSFKKVSYTVAFMSLVTLVSACGTARLVRSTPGTGGEIALLGSQEKAREQADIEMRRICGSGRPEVTEEGETVIGTSTVENGTVGKNPWEKNSLESSNRTESVQKTEWRLKFKCVNAK